MDHFIYEDPHAEEVIISDPVDRIANIAHSCYQVAPKPHESNLLFVKNLCSVYHMAMLDHGFIHLKFKKEDFLKLVNVENKEFYDIPWEYSKYFHFAMDQHFVYLTLSLRSLANSIDAIYKAMNENKNKDIKENFVGVNQGQSFAHLVKHIVNNIPDEWKTIVLTHFGPDDDLVSLFEGVEDKALFEILSEEEIRNLPYEIRKSQQFLVYSVTTDRGVTHELVRHRACAFAQESTRYCNYSKQKFGDCIHVIKPLDYENHSALYDKAFETAAEIYLDLLKEGAKPEEARAVLPTNLKAQITINANLEEWEHIFFQRLAPDAHPEARRAVQFIYDDMKKKGYIE